MSINGIYSVNKIYSALKEARWSTNESSNLPETYSYDLFSFKLLLVKENSINVTFNIWVLSYFILLRALFQKEINTV